ncbi:MAG: DUF86 domain-containing protein [Deltaproteobacteria bacterium]|nr:DUF86 domain-containing protein [Deltaproteobacteria bacterium]
MVKAELVAAKLAQLADRIDRIEQHRPASLAALAANRDALDLLSFNLLLAVQVCADVAAHLISDEGLPPAPNLAQSFARLHEHGVIGDAVVGPIQRAVGLRNVVAHGYERIDPNMVYQAATVGIADLKAFAADVARWLQHKRSA